MRALQVARFGGPEVLEWVELPDPAPGAGEVLVRVRAFAVNWADLLEREGRYPGQPEPPFVGGHDFVGEVVAHGSGVEQPSIGSRVFGVTPRGGVTAELVSVPAGWVYPVPDSVGDLQAAGMAGAYLTAEVAIRCFARLEPGDSVLIHAAAGGLGSACFQLCKAHGAGTIIATAGSAEKVARLLEWGADVAVDYTVSDFVQAVLAATEGAGVDVAFESVGGDVLERSFDCVAPGGRLVCLGASAGRSTSRFRLHTLFEKGISVSGFTLGLWIEAGIPAVAEAAKRVLDLAGRGAISTVIGGVFRAEEAAEAHRFLADRRSIGRTIVVLDPGVLR